MANDIFRIATWESPWPVTAEIDADQIRIKTNAGVAVLSHEDLDRLVLARAEYLQDIATIEKRKDIAA